MDMDNKDIIYLTLLNGTGYVFDRDDYLKLRKKRIMGSFVGTSNARGWSVEHTALPIELTPYETRLAVEQNLALLVSKRGSLTREPSSSELTEYNENHEKSMIDQAEASKAEKIREAEQNIDKILAGKREKLMREGATDDTVMNLNAASVLHEIGEMFSFDRKNSLIEIPCAHPRPHDAKIVHLPADNSLKYNVYRDLWLRGLYITPGSVFGGDFLIYPGDPMLYHASHIVILLEDVKLKSLCLVTKARLSVSVNKKCVLAYFADKDNDGKENGLRKIQYQTIKWKGNYSEDLEEPNDGSDYIVTKVIDESSDSSQDSASDGESDEFLSDSGSSSNSGMDED